MTSPIVHRPHGRPDRVVVEMKEVESRSIRRVGYNDETQQLVVHFHDSLPGLRTVYEPVPREHYDALVGSRSMGAYLDEHIRYVYDFSLVNEANLVRPDGEKA